MKQTDKSKSSLLVTALVMGLVFILSVVNKKWTPENIVQEPLAVNKEAESKEYKELSEYVDSISIAYETNSDVEDYKVSLERLNDEEVEELYLDIVSTTKGDATFEEVMRIEANTFAPALIPTNNPYLSARYLAIVFAQLVFTVLLQNSFFDQYYFLRFREFLFYLLKIFSFLKKFQHEFFYLLKLLLKQNLINQHLKYKLS